MDSLPTGGLLTVATAIKSLLASAQCEIESRLIVVELPVFY